MVIRVIDNAFGQPAGKLADVELIFGDGPLAGLKLIGAQIWERRDGRRTVTMPARHYTVNGERRCFALLRPAGPEPDAQNRLQDLILQAYDDQTRTGTETT